MFGGLCALLLRGSESQTAGQGEVDVQKQAGGREPLILAGVQGLAPAVPPELTVHAASWGLQNA